MEPAVRSNLVIAIGDLAFRFPNMLEPWTAKMYEPLSDPDDGKRRMLFADSLCLQDQSCACTNMLEPWTAKM